MGESPIFCPECGSAVAIILVNEFDPNLYECGCCKCRFHVFTCTECGGHDFRDLGYSMFECRDCGSGLDVEVL